MFFHEGMKEKEKKKLNFELRPINGTSIRNRSQKKKRIRNRWFKKKKKNYDDHSVNIPKEKRE